MIDREEMVREYKFEYDVEVYDQYLRNMTKKELLQYFENMQCDQLVGCIKELYGKDGIDDCNFEA